MVARVVHTALAVQTVIAIRIKNRLVRLNERIRYIDALQILTVFFQRDMCVLHMTVAAPFQIAGTLAALVRIIEIDGILQRLGKIDLDVVIGKAARIRKLLVLVIDRSRILTCCTERGQTGDAGHHG